MIDLLNFLPIAGGSAQIATLFVISYIALSVRELKAWSITHQEKDDATALKVANIEGRLNKKE